MNPPGQTVVASHVGMASGAAMDGKGVPPNGAVSKDCISQARATTAGRPSWLSVASTSSIVRPARSVRMAVSTMPIGRVPRMS